LPVRRLRRLSHRYVYRPLRQFLFVCCVVGGVWANGPENTGLSDAEMRSLLAAAEPTWLFTGSASTALGYNDNILLSSIDPVGRAFGRLNVDSLLWHVPRGRIDYFAFLNGSYTRYSQRVLDETGNVIDHKSEAFGGIEWRFKQPDWLVVTGDLQGYALDEVFDLTNLTGKRDVENLDVRGAKVGPTVRWLPWKWLWLEGNATLDRQKFAGGLNDATIHDAAARLALKPTAWVELRGEVSERHRAFTQRHPYDPNLRDFDAGLLAITERARDVRLTTTVGHARHWVLASTVGVSTYSDNALGDLDFHDRHAREEIDWTAGKWTVHAEGAARHKSYDNQTVGFGNNLPAQIKDEYDAQLRVEKKVSSAWTVFVEYSWERTRSNDDQIASYRSNEGLLGARWSWEK